MHRKVVEVRAVDGDILAMVLGTLPEHIENVLVDKLEGCLARSGSMALHNVDSAADGGASSRSYDSLHFDYYSRMGESVSLQWTRI